MKTISSDKVHAQGGDWQLLKARQYGSFQPSYNQGLIRPLAANFYWKLYLATYIFGD
jgi:hypothetical protein